MREAFAVLIWTKQYYNLDDDRWLAEHGVSPWLIHAPAIRNHEWFHMVNQDSDAGHVPLH